MNSQSNNHHAWAEHQADDAKDVAGNGGKEPADKHVDTSSILPTKAFQVDPNTDTWSAFPQAPVLWTAQPVLDWVESLAAATEQGESQQMDHNTSPINIGGIDLSTPVPPLPVPPHMPTSSDWAPDSVSSRPADYVHQRYQDNDRKRVHQDSLPSGEIATTPRWDLSYIQSFDASGTRQFQSNIYPLAVRFESDRKDSSTHQDLSLAYYDMQTTFDFKFFRIMDQRRNGTPSDFDESRLLDVLYKETLQKLQALINKTASGACDKDDDDDKYKHAAMHPKKAALTKPVPKKDFSKYMTAWLRENWTNPYPDEDGLAEMAGDCGTTSTVVSNWLINARTRKWRPAIVKATEMCRPSDYLLEDSIQVFDGNPVRPLTGHDDEDHANEEEGDGGANDYYRPVKRVKREPDY